MNKKSILIIVLCFLLLSALSVYAHKMIVFAWVDGSIIHVEGSFGSNRKVKKADVVVTDEHGQVVHQGTVDSEGKHSFKKPDSLNSGLIVTLDAGSGHKASWAIEKEELKAAFEPDDNSRKNEADSTSVQKAELAERKMEELEKSPPLINIMAGIGLIFLLAYVLKLVHGKKGSND